MEHSPLLKKILAKRNIVDIDNFLSPSHPLDISLFDLGIKKTDFKKALSLIKQHSKKKEPVIVYGDYDADGITSTAILWETLHYSGINSRPFIPHRQSHGYGLSIAGIDAVIQEYHPSLIICVDNGIVAHEAIKYAQQKKIDVIVIDHHLKDRKVYPEELRRRAIIHSTEVAGAGLTWFFSKELVRELKFSFDPNSTLELAAIGTVTDLVPLLGINRSLVKFGLENLQHTSRLGLQSLINIAGLKNNLLDTYHLGFHIGPRLNAMGRLEHAIDSLRLLCTKKIDQAQKLAKLLNDTNHERQELTDNLTEIALELAQSQKNNPVIIVAHSDFHEGIIGLIASKLVQKFWRPAIVLALNKKLYKASARSIPGFNIIEAIRHNGDLLESAGGHPMAAGFNIQIGKLEKFTKTFLDHAKELLTPDLLKRHLNIDVALQFNELTNNLADELDLLAPFGIGNSKPILSTTKVNIADSRTVGADGKHLKLRLQNNNQQFSAIGFGMGHLHDKLSSNKPVNISYHLTRNTWNGKTNLELQLKSLQPNR